LYFVKQCLKLRNAIVHFIFVVLKELKSSSFRVVFFGQSNIHVKVT